jgi:hypothetical protein
MKTKALALYIGLPLLFAVAVFVYSLGREEFRIDMFVSYILVAPLFYSAPQLLWAGIATLVKPSAFVWHAGFIGCTVVLLALAIIPLFGRDPSGLPLQWMLYWPLTIGLLLLLAAGSPVYHRFSQPAFDGNKKQ